jgi:hypothetical protein
MVTPIGIELGSAAVVKGHPRLGLVPATGLVYPLVRESPHGCGGILERTLPHSLRLVRLDLHG